MARLLVSSISHANDSNELVPVVTLMVSRVESKEQKLRGFPRVQHRAHYLEYVLFK